MSIPAEIPPGAHVAAVAHPAPVAFDREFRKPGGEGALILPVRGHPPTIQQAGAGQQKGTGAHARDDASRFGSRAQRREYVWRGQLGLVFAAGHDEHIEWGVGAHHLVGEYAKTAACGYHVRSGRQQARVQVHATDAAGRGKHFIGAAEVEHFGLVVNINADLHGVSHA